MANKDLPKLNIAIQEKRYRDAREIIETGDLDAKTAAKWRQWLAELHHEERENVGISTDKEKPKIKPVETVRLSEWEIAGRLFLTVIAAAMLYQAADFAAFAAVYSRSCFAVFWLWIFGAWGWGRFLTIVNEKYGRILGVAVTLAIPFLIIGLYDPPGSYNQVSFAQYRVAIFLISLPGVGALIWNYGGTLSRKVLDFFEPPLRL